MELNLKKPSTESTWSWCMAFAKNLAGTCDYNSKGLFGNHSGQLPRLIEKLPQWLCGPSPVLPAAAGSPAGHRAGFKQCSDALQFFIQLLTWVDKKCIKRLKPENRKKSIYHYLFYQRFENSKKFNIFFVLMMYYVFGNILFSVAKKYSSRIRIRIRVRKLLLSQLWIHNSGLRRPNPKSGR